MNKENFKQYIKDSFNELSTYNGNKSTIHNRLVLERSVQSVGIVDSVMTTDSIVYAIIRRCGSDPDNFDLSTPDGYYNCNGDVTCYSPFELMIPLININLSVVPLNPQQLVGGKVLVSEIDGIAMKAEYIGILNEVNESPVNIPRTVLTSIRNYIGGYVKLDSDDLQIRNAVDSFGIPQDTLKKLNSYSVSDWSGNVVRFDTDAVMYRDVKQQDQGELVLKDNDSLSQLIRHINQKDMKTKRCHLPTTLFSAR